MGKLVDILVKTNAREQGVEKMGQDRLKVKLMSIPEKGEANKELVEVLSKFFGVYKDRIHILSGKTSRKKKVEIDLY